MANINVLVPPLDRTTFSGGTLCVLQYAKGLRARGHRVNVIPLLPSRRPEWIEGDFGWLPEGGLRSGLARICAAAVSCLKPSNFGRKGRKRLLASIEQLTASVALAWPPAVPAELQAIVGLLYVRGILQNELPPADVTLATAYQTALPAHLYGTGAKYYFAQHFEPLFSMDAADPGLANYEATSSYALGLRLIANSTWLKGKLEAESGGAVELCSNAIEHSIFNGAPKTGALGREVKVISYGGRSAKWKGFRDMAEGMRIARKALPEFKLIWRVYGPCELEPSNEIADFESLGFLDPRSLAAAYRESDMLLSASWYESFPLFPLEAMACGLPVITSAPGTEEFATNGITAHIVEARNPENIAQAIVRLVSDPTYRAELAVRGNEVAKTFTWDSAVARMEQLLLGSKRAPPQSGASL